MEFKDMIFNESNLIKNKIIKIDENKVTVHQYLPIDDKTKLISFVINGAMDFNTGCFSPVRTEVFFSIAIIKWYTDIDFSEEDLLNIGDTYDKLEKFEISDKVVAAIPQSEYTFIQELVQDTVTDIARYNSSFTGALTLMNGSASSLDKQLTDILEKIKNKEGMELLSVIKDVGGTD